MLWIIPWKRRENELIRAAEVVANALSLPGTYFTEALNQPVKEDDDEKDWKIPDSRDGQIINAFERREAVKSVRWLATYQPHVKQASRLYRSYVLGRGFQIRLVQRDTSKAIKANAEKTMKKADRYWNEFLIANRKHWSIAQFGNRVWRDGEQFTQKWMSNGTPQVRFIDPEEIDDYEGDTQGIVTAKNDVADVRQYLRINPETHLQTSVLDADDVFHTKIDADSTEKRGVTRYLSVIRFTKQFRSLVDIEIRHRKLQTSIVMQRKVHGRPAQARAQLDAMKTSTTEYLEGEMDREKIRPGTILTTNMGTEIEFKTPNSNFSDASPLARLLILHVSAATGFPYYMVSTDSSDNNFASSLVQESPVVMMVEEEQDFFKWEIYDIWRWVLGVHIARGDLPRSLLDDFVPDFQFPSLVTREPLKVAQTHNLQIMQRSKSRKQVMRELNVDPDMMNAEIDAEIEHDEEMGVVHPGAQLANDPAATGGNQGDDGSQVGGHDDDTGSRTQTR